MKANLTLIILLLLLCLSGFFNFYQLRERNSIILKKSLELDSVKNILNKKTEDELKLSAKVDSVYAQSVKELEAARRENNK